VARALSRAPPPRDSRPGLGRDTTVWLQGAIQKSGGYLLGRGYQASVYQYNTPAGALVVKSPHESRWLGWLWRYLIRREDSVYARLRGVPGVPRSFGLIDGRHLVLEHIAGPSLRQHEARLHDREQFFEQLLETLRAMHAAGVAHCDLKRKDNVIVGPGDRPYLIDFGVAWQRSETHPILNRVWFQSGKQMDYNAWIKLKYQRRIEHLSAPDAALYRPLLLERLARTLRIPWQKITLRRPRQRWRARRAQDRAKD
jgi:serine/threonine protein kinase